MGCCPWSSSRFRNSQLVSETANSECVVMGTRAQPFEADRLLIWGILDGYRAQTPRHRFHRSSESSRPSLPSPGSGQIRQHNACLLANDPKRDVTWEYVRSLDKLPELAIAVGQLPSGELIYPLSVRISHESGARGDSYSQFAGAYTWEGLQGLYFLDENIVKQRPGLQSFPKQTRILVESSR